VIVDPDTKAFLEHMQAAAAQAPADPAIEDIRAAVEAFRPHGMPFEPVARVEEVEADGPGGRAKARLYLPAGGDAGLPCLVWVHGGSWVRVTVDLLDTMFRYLANASGCAVVAVDYRLAPEHRFPTPLEDVYATARWIRENAARYAIDSDRIAIGGESAGANLAAAAVLLDQERREVGFAHQSLIVPILDLRLESGSWESLGGGDFLLTTGQARWSVEQYAGERDITDWRLSPLAYGDLGGVPPTHVITGGLDPLRDDGVRFAERLREADVFTVHDHFPSMIHHATMVPALLESGRGALSQCARQLGWFFATGAARVEAELPPGAG